MKIFKYLLCGLLLVGCTSTKQSETTATTTEKVEESSEVQNTSYPIVIEHAYGETVIESEPQNIVTISWSNQDVPLALGIVPVGVSKASFGPVNEQGLLPWTSDAFKKLGVENPNVFDDVDGLDYEAIANAKPDVILASYSGITEEEYNLLSEIAPVVAFKNKPWVTYWRDIILEDSLGMGKLEQGEALVNELDTYIEQKVANYPNLAEKKVVFTMFNASDTSSFYAYTSQDPRANFLLDLGFLPVKAVEDMSDGSTFYVTVSAEKADVLNDADIIVMYGDEEMLKVLQADKIIGKIPAIAAGNVVLLDYSSEIASAVNPTALSIPYSLEDYLALFNTALQK